LEELTDFVHDLYVDDQRHIRERLTEDELELFDIQKRECYL